MEHDWTSLTTDIKMKHSDRVDIDSVEGHNQTPVLESLSKKYLNGESIHVNGYPTIFKIENGKIHYYNGARKRHQMLKWILNIRDPFRHGMHGGKTRKNDLTRKNKTIKKNRSWLTLW
jgi:hypothetical protein